MKKFVILLLSTLIVLAFFSGCSTEMPTVTETVKSQHSIFHTPVSNPGLVPTPARDPTTKPTPEPTPEPTPIPEPLTGKKLYISYIDEIVSNYYPAVDPYIVMAVMEIESDYQPNVGSYNTVVGLMQVMPRYHYWRIEQYGLTDLWDPYTNIICGVDLLDELYAKYGDWSRALYGYNHSQKYVNKVLNKADILRKDGYFG